MNNSSFKYLILFVLFIVLYVNILIIYHYKTNGYVEEIGLLVKNIENQNKQLEESLRSVVENSISKGFRDNSLENNNIIQGFKDEIKKEIREAGFNVTILDQINNGITKLKMDNLFIEESIANVSCSFKSEEYSQESTRDKIEDKEENLFNRASGGYNIKKDIIRNNCGCFNMSNPTLVFSDYRTGSTNLLNVLNGCGEGHFLYELFRDLNFPPGYEKFRSYLKLELSKGKSFKLQSEFFYLKYKYMEYFLDQHKDLFNLNLLILERENKLNQFISWKISTSHSNKMKIADPVVRYHYETKEEKVDIDYEFDRVEYIEWINYQNQYYDDLINFVYNFNNIYCVNYITYEEYIKNWEICQQPAPCKSKIMG
eukprot:TRINITY_DN13590_c0_g1_i1.p1 TRINITY_DN13590_c0_g1~~TRINITY_DN13590_c0_g1_i1.p1  ORF type:complete len:370 (-),score=63.93 TRINITY_DN13590_c0_g1_i1:117-1226(-)